MARRPRGIERSTIQFRVDKEFKERLEALAYREREHPDLSPDEVNMSEFVRKIVTTVVEQFEQAASSAADGADGRVRLAAEYAEAVRRQKLAELEAAEKKEAQVSATLGRLPGNVITNN